MQELISEFLKKFTTFQKVTIEEGQLTFYFIDSDEPMDIVEFLANSPVRLAMEKLKQDIINSEETNCFECPHTDCDGIVESDESCGDSERCHKCDGWI